jgi:esterase/lipase
MVAGLTEDPMLHLLTAGLLLLAPARAATDQSLTTKDGVKLHARVEKQKGATRGVVLVHMLGRSAEDWSYLSGKLLAGGFQVVAPDLRGHGGSTATVKTLTDADYPKMVQDVAASVAWLRSQGVTEITCVGASLGANLCVQAASADPAVGSLVLLSPGLNYKGVTSGDALGLYGNRPVLLVASKDDAYSARSVTLLEESAKGQKSLLLLEEAGHGTKMLNRDPSLEGQVMAWLNGSYKLSNGESVSIKPAVAADVGTVQTEGTRLGQ